MIWHDFVRAEQGLVVHTGKDKGYPNELFKMHGERMNRLVEIGEEAKSLLHNLRAEQASDVLLSASDMVNEESTSTEKELIDWYAFYAFAIKESRLPSEITSSECAYLESSLEDHERTQAQLDELLTNIVEWFSEIDSLRSDPRISRPFRNPKSKAPQNRLRELKSSLEKQLDGGLSEYEWESTLSIIEEQNKYIIGWQVYSGSGRGIWTTTKPGCYGKYAGLIMKRNDVEDWCSEIRGLVDRAVSIENEREEIRGKLLSYSNKSSSIEGEIDRVIKEFSEVHRASDSSRE